jgi:hypothetical protein
MSGGRVRIRLIRKFEFQVFHPNSDCLRRSFASEEELMTFCAVTNPIQAERNIEKRTHFAAACQVPGTHMIT